MLLLQGVFRIQLIEVTILDWSESSVEIWVATAPAVLSPQK
jgi:hypothetical protein